MSIECYSLTEHFEYMKNYVPQPLYIKGEMIEEFALTEDESSIKTKKATYTLNKSTTKKLVDSLGIKIKLFSESSKEVSVVDQVIPAINKLLKCFTDCFVFYTSKDDSFYIIDLNLHNVKGDEGTKYEHGPSPWDINISDDPSVFTCFNHFMERLCIDEEDRNIMVKADDLMPSLMNVSFNLFKSIPESVIQPMLQFSSKFSNMNGFSEIKPSLYDTETNTYITFPVNYVKPEADTFEKMWGKLLHIHQTTDLDDYIFREINELSASKETPKQVKGFISTIQVENTVNVNQSIRGILLEGNSLATEMKPSKARKFKQQLGALIGWCLCMRHSSCAKCGHIELEE